VPADFFSKLFRAEVVSCLADQQHFADGIARQKKLDGREITEEIFYVPIIETR